MVSRGIGGGRKSLLFNWPSASTRSKVAWIVAWYFFFLPSVVKKHEERYLTLNLYLKFYRTKVYLRLVVKQQIDLTNKLPRSSFGYLIVDCCSIDLTIFVETNVGNERDDSTNYIIVSGKLHCRMFRRAIILCRNIYNYRRKLQFHFVDPLQQHKKRKMYL